MTGSDDTPHFRPHQRVTVEGWPGTILGSHRNSAGGPAYAVSLDDRGVFSVNARQIVPAGDGQLPFPEETTRVRLRQLANGLRDLEARIPALVRECEALEEIRAVMGTGDERIARMLCRWAAAKYGIGDVTRVAFWDGSHGPYSEVTPDVDTYIEVQVWTVERERLLEEQRARGGPARGERWAVPHKFEEMFSGELITDILRFALEVGDDHVRG